jgi:AAA domain
VAASERIEGERAERIENGRNLLSFGVGFLDQAMVGILRRDLVLIGGPSGIGKTQMAVNIAMTNCRDNRRVHYFALEAEDREIERRMKFQIIADLYYREFAGTHHRIRYADWYTGRLDELLGRFEDADRALRRITKNLSTYYRVESFTGDDFARQLAVIREETDLVILDHFHYVDSPDDNENRAAKALVKTIRECVLRAERPVVVVAHVRKSDPRNAPLVPNEEAFHGSSDLVKIATKAIMIAPDHETPQESPTLFPTYLRIVKFRQEHAVTRYVARVNYDVRNDTYETFYVIGRLGSGGQEFVPLDKDQHPIWKYEPSTGGGT